MYKSDQDIEKEFNGWKLQSIKFEPKTRHDTIWFQAILEFPEAGESVAGGQEGYAEICDNGYYDMKYDRVVCENWYPDSFRKEFDKLVREKVTA